MTENDRCVICGVPATHHLGNSESLPLCDNIVCYHAALEMVNTALQLAAEEMKRGNHVTSV